MVPVKLPKEVLNLFPTWEYRCPCCSTYVESSKSFCPNCKTPFDEKKWRLPPRFLKSYDVMSDYAHKVLAPKLTPQQRELLFEYFTELFSDGFESGDFSAWTGTVGTPTVETDNPHHGTYNAEANASVSTYCYKTFTATDPCYARMYVKFGSLSHGSGTDMQFMGIDNGAWNYGIKAAVYNDSGTYVWGLVCVESATTNHYSAVAVSTGTWYCVALYRDVTNDLQKLYIDGVAVVESSDSQTNNCSRVRAGFVYVASATVMYYDCVVVADTYIGPEDGAQPFTKTWATDSLFKKLGITKSLAVDVALQKRGTTETADFDALFKRFDVLKSFAVDAHFGALMTQTISKQIDVLLKRLDATATFGLDAYFGPIDAGTYAEVFALDVVFAYKVRLPELWLDENGKIVLNISKPYTWVGT